MQVGLVELDRQLSRGVGREGSGLPGGLAADGARGAGLAGDGDGEAFRAIETRGCGGCREGQPPLPRLS